MKIRRLFFTAAFVLLRFGFSQDPPFENIHERFLLEGFAGKAMMEARIKHRDGRNNPVLIFYDGDSQYEVYPKISYDEKKWRFTWKDKPYQIDFFNETYFEEASVVRRKIWRVFRIMAEEEGGCQIYLTDSKEEKRTREKRAFAKLENGEWRHLDILSQTGAALNVENYPIADAKGEIVVHPAVLNVSQGFVIVASKRQKRFSFLTRFYSPEENFLD